MNGGGLTPSNLDVLPVNGEFLQNGVRMEMGGRVLVVEGHKCTRLLREHAHVLHHAGPHVVQQFLGCALGRHVAKVHGTGGLPLIICDAPRAVGNCALLVRLMVVRHHVPHRAITVVRVVESGIHVVGSNPGGGSSSGSGSGGGSGRREGTKLGARRKLAACGGSWVKGRTHQELRWQQGGELHVHGKKCIEEEKW